MSSLPDTLAKSVSRTPDAKSATSTLDRLLPVPLASNVLFVNVSVVARPTSVSVPLGMVCVFNA